MPRSAFWLRAQTLLSLSCGVIASPMLGDTHQKVLHDEPLLHQESQPRQLHGRFLHITDFHPDELYKPHTSTEDGIACHRGHGMAGTYGAEMTDCDSPFSLLDSTMQWVEENLRGKIDFVIWTGDSARHDSDESHPRTEKTVLDSNKAVADKIIKTFSSPKGKLEIPIIPTFGNNDFLPHNIMYPGPNRWFTAYGDIWKRFIPEEQRHAFQFGGWFHVDVVPDKLAVFSLNTMYFFDRNAAVDGCALPSEPGYKHMEWLRVQLDLMRQTGKKAILMGHVPPARTDSKQNWDETCWQRYTLWLQKYRDVVVASLFGHMNIDHFLLGDTKDIDLAAAGGQNTNARNMQRQSINEGDFLVQGKDDYLQELRGIWSDLPKSAIKVLDNDDDSVVEAGHKKGKKKKKKGKFRKIGGEYAERYQLALISPSIVPNYFPTLRVYEYNMTGLENAAVWEEQPYGIDSAQSVEFDGAGETDLELRSIDMEKTTKKKKKGKKNKKGKKGKDKPKDPNLIIPDDPPKGSLPGPAYYPQQFTLTGYTQYYANLTHINNDQPDLDDIQGTKWRNGNHGDRKPKHKPAQPRKFQFEVEYSTFDDKKFKLKDLTVRSYLNLAYRMGQQSKKKNSVAGEEVDGGSQDGSVGKNRKKGGKEKNQTWLHWLGFAFVSTIGRKDLEEM